MAKVKLFYLKEKLKILFVLVIRCLEHPENDPSSKYEKKNSFKSLYPFPINVNDSAVVLLAWVWWVQPSIYGNESVKPIKFWALVTKIQHTFWRMNFVEYEMIWIGISNPSNENPNATTARFLKRIFQRTHQVTHEIFLFCKRNYFLQFLQRPFFPSICAFWLNFLFWKISKCHCSMGKYQQW